VQDKEANLISQEKIDEWIREVEQRPSSAELIIRYIANRLSELSKRDEELLAQNIELISRRKVEEYESHIASLEYQLELLKRQLGGEVVLPKETPQQPAITQKLNVWLYNPLGQVLKIELEPDEIGEARQIASLVGEVSPGGMQPELLATTSQEELLLIFDSGRTVRLPAYQLPASSVDGLDWAQAYLEEPRVREELAAIQPIARMPLYQLCIQVSRRGYVKKINMASFTSHVEEDYIGKGVLLPADKPCTLAFANPEDLFVMVSQEGYIFSMPAAKLPAAIQEVIQLAITDHIVSAFVVSQQPSIVFITANGKVGHREASWLEPARSFKSMGQAILSKSRREAGARIVGAALAEQDDWAVFLHLDGSLSVAPVNDLLATGSLPGREAEAQIVSFSVFKLPHGKAETGHAGSSEPYS
jgi:DNA gyrase/topoisomerase IV subunit A